MQQGLKFKRASVIIWKTICKVLYHAICFAFPAVSLCKANKKIDEKIKKIQDTSVYEYMNGYKDLPLEKIEDFYKKTFEYQKSFEDKAKVSVLAVTLSVTVIMGIAGILFNMSNSNAPIALCLKIFIYFITVLILIHLVTASYLSLHMIGGINMMYEMFPSNANLSSEDKKDLLAQFTELNVKLNNKRNNYLYSSNKSITMALFFLLVLFLSIVIVTNSDNKVDIKKMQTTQNQILIEINNLKSQQNLLNSLVQNIDNTKADASTQINLEKDIINLEDLQKNLNGQISKLEKELYDLKQELQKK